MQGATRVLDRKRHKHLNPNASHISLQIHLRWAFISGGVDPAIAAVWLEVVAKRAVVGVTGVAAGLLNIELALKHECIVHAGMVLLDVVVCIAVATTASDCNAGVETVVGVIAVPAVYAVVGGVVGACVLITLAVLGATSGFVLPVAAVAVAVGWVALLVYVLQSLLACIAATLEFSNSCCLSCNRRCCLLVSVAPTRRHCACRGCYRMSSPVYLSICNAAQVDERSSHDRGAQLRWAWPSAMF